MCFIEEALHRGFLDGAIHSFDLSVGPWVIRLGEAVFDSVGMAGPVEWLATEACGGSLAVLRKIGELDAVAGEHRVDAIRNGYGEGFEEGGGSPHIDQCVRFKMRGFIPFRICCV
jgi:hypothetical protein